MSLGRHKVRTGSIYRYEPVLLDRIDQPHDIKTGDLVRVVKLPGWRFVFVWEQNA